MVYLSAKELLFAPVAWTKYASNIRKEFETLDNFGRDVEMYEFEIITKGEAILCVNGVEYHIKPGETCFKKPGDYMADRKSVYECYSVCFRVYNINTGEEVDGTKYSSFLDEYPTVTKPKNHDEIAHQLMIIKSGPSSRSERNELKMKIVTANLLYLLYDSLEKDREYEHAYHPAVNKAIKYFYANADTAYTMEDVAKYVGLDVKYFQKIFKKCTGKTPNYYSTEVRLYYAKEKLANSDAPIYDIAQESGYTSVNYFNHVFKKFYNQTPTEYRKNPK